MRYAACERALGDYAASLDWARQGREKFAEDRDLVIAEVMALSSLGRIDETKRLIEDHVSQPAVGETFEHRRVFELLVDSGLEMRAHGYRDASDAALRRAVEWYEARSVGDSVNVADRWRLARSLYAAERWEEADSLFSAISAEELSGHRDLLSHNAYVSLVGYQAVLAVRLGAADKAALLDEELSTMRRPFLWGHATYWRAAVAAVRRDSAQAINLLNRALAEGLFAAPWGTEYPKWDYHIDPDFESVRDYEPFQALIGPRG